MYFVEAAHTSQKTEYVHIPPTLIQCPLNIFFYIYNLSRIEHQNFSGKFEQKNLTVKKMCQKFYSFVELGGGVDDGLI